MTLLIRDIGKIPYSCSYNNYPQSSSSWHAGESSSSRQAFSAKAAKKNYGLSSIEEKARLLLSRNQIMNLLHSISEYDGRKMPVETFVSVILDMLDTQEKVSLHFYTTIDFCQFLNINNKLIVNARKKIRYVRVRKRFLSFN